MLQRAASNAYSWWWASHIRTKQSKWLEQNLQDMEEKVHYTLKIIDDDGDTFAQRAEMYYRKRPEIVNFVEDAFRSYRALAERYDHLSRDLQSANRTIATAFPEQAQFLLDDDDEENSNKQPRNQPTTPKGGSIPKVPETPKKYFRSPSMFLPRKGQLRTIYATKAAPPPRSGLSKSEALEKIDKLQKGILALQTEKEFVKSSYEREYEKYWEIENEITDLQRTVCNLQDEFGIGIVINDNEARTLMTTTALKSVRETLSKLEEKQKQSEEEAKGEQGRIKEAHKKFAALRNEFISKQMESYQSEAASASPELKGSDQEMGKDLEVLGDKELEANSNSILTLTQLTEKIDELVDKVVYLETGSSSQAALVKRLRSETDELHAHICSLEEEKGSLIKDSNNMINKIKELEEELCRVRSLNQSFEDQNNNLQKQLTEANFKIDYLSNRLHSVNMDENVENSALFDEVRASADSKSDKGIEKHPHDNSETTKEEKKDDVLAEGGVKLDDVSQKLQEPQVQEEKAEKKDFSVTASSNFDIELEESETEEEEDQHDWRQKFSNGLEDREKVLVEEYTSVLRNYRDVKRKLGEVEKRNRDGFFELALQIRELKNAVAFRDVEIESLRHKLSSPHKGNNEIPEGNQSEYRYSHQEPTDEAISQIYSSPTSNFSSLSSLQPQVFVSLHERSTAESKETINESAAAGDLKKPHTKADMKVKNSIPTVEEGIRSDIDELLEENLEFWLRFSTSFHQITKFETTTQDLKAELSKLENTRKQDENTNHQSFVSDARPIYKHLREIQTELTLWLENNAILKDELQSRFSSLCNIQDEISRVTNTSRKGIENEFTGYQAAKFHGEVLSLKQENTKITNELQAGLDRMSLLKVEVENILAKIEDDLRSSASKNPQSQMRSSSGWPKVPLRSFLFGVKLRKHKQHKSSLFSCMSPSLQKQYSYTTKPGGPGLPQ